MATNRRPVASSLRKVTLVGSEKLYFFQKSYEEYIAVPSTEAISNLFDAAENELNILHSSNFTVILNKYVPSKNVPINPFGIGVPSSLLTQLREQGDQYKSGLPYVDLCVILGEYDKAENFAKSQNKEYDILAVHRSSKGTTSTVNFVAAAAKIILEGKNSDSARLTSLIYRAVDNDQAHYLLVVAEFWSLGFHWDAYCLAKLKYPDAVFTKELANMLEERIHSQSESSTKQRSAVQNMIKSEKTDYFTGFTDSFLQDEDPIMLYRLLKCLIMKNEQCADEMKKLNGRIKIAVSLRQLALSIMIKVGPMEAVTMIGDVLEFLKTKPDLLGDFFNLRERLMFEKTIGMIGDVYTAIERVSSSNGTANQQVLLKDIRDRWHQRVPDLWRDNSQRDSLKELSSSLQHSLSSIEKCFSAPYKIKTTFLKYAISFLSDLVASNDVTAMGTTQLADQKFASIVRDIWPSPPATPKRSRAPKEAPAVPEGETNTTGESSFSGSATNNPPPPRVFDLDAVLKSVNYKPPPPRHNANTKMEFKSGGFEIDDGKESKFGKWELQNGFAPPNRGHSNGSYSSCNDNLNKSFAGQQSNSYRGRGNGTYRGSNPNNSFAQPADRGHRNDNGSFRGDNLNKSMYNSKI